MNSPSSVSAFTAPIAAPAVSVGRMIETGGNFRLLRKNVGSGMIRFVCVSSLPVLRFGKVSPLVGSVSGMKLPALSCQVWKCCVSVGPMLSRMRRTSGFVTRCASDG